MAKKSDIAVKQYAKKKVSRPGVHSKNSSSCNKSSKNYRKKYVGQGK